MQTIAAKLPAIANSVFHVQCFGRIGAAIKAPSSQPRFASMRSRSGRFSFTDSFPSLDKMRPLREPTRQTIPPWEHAQSHYPEVLGLATGLRRGVDQPHSYLTGKQTNHLQTDRLQLRSDAVFPPAIRLAHPRHAPFGGLTSEILHSLTAHIRVAPTPGLQSFHSAHGLPHS